MPRNFRTERDTTIQRWYGNNLQPNNPDLTEVGEKTPLSLQTASGFPHPSTHPLTYGDTA